MTLVFAMDPFFWQDVPKKEALQLVEGTKQMDDIESRSAYSTWSCQSGKTSTHIKMQT